LSSILIKLKYFDVIPDGDQNKRTIIICPLSDIKMA